MYPGNGHLLASLLALALLALISPSTTTAFKLQGKRTTEVVEPDVSKPSFELCNFPAVLLDINYPFILTALSDDLPVRSWPILLRFPSDTIPQSLYISRSGISQPLFILNGNLSTGGTDGRLTPAKIQSTSKSSKSLFFGGKAKGEYPDWWTTRSCDAQGRPFTELKTTQRKCC